MEVKEVWIKEIKKVLMGQFDQLKGKARKEIPTIPLPGWVLSHRYLCLDSRYWKCETAPHPSLNCSDSENVHIQENSANNNHQGGVTSSPSMEAAGEGDEEENWTSDEEHSNHESSYSDSQVNIALLVVHCSIKSDLRICHIVLFLPFKLWRPSRMDTVPRTPVGAHFTWLLIL